jgi:predicted N-acetyltransferase YhbS
MKIQYSIANSTFQVKQALELATEVFRRGPSDDENRYKDLLWFKEPTFAPENIFIATCDEQVIGVIRAVPREFLFARRFDQASNQENASLSVPAVCISSVCINEKFRGQGISRKLTEYACETLKLRGIGFCYLLARRAVDHYYNRFGFYGVSTYHTLALNNPTELSALEVREIEVKPFLGSSFPAALALKAYAESYSGSSGLCARGEGHWLHLLMRLPFLEHIRIWQIEKSKSRIGYAICDQKSVLEIAYIDPSDGGAIAAAISRTLNLSSFVVPNTHPLITSLTSLDINVTSRICTYGGHMVKILNEDVGLKIREALALPPASSGRLASLNPTERISYDLAATWPTTPDLASLSSFSLSFPEHF